MLYYDDPLHIQEYARRILPDHAPLAVERVQEGGSTIVYRVQSAANTWYVRIRPEADSNLDAEAAVHRTLSGLGLRVPPVIHVEPFHPFFRRSVMMTGAIQGDAIGNHALLTAMHPIVRQAGYELARINQVVVQGYGWLDRTGPQGELIAEYPTLPEWLQGHFAEPIRALSDCPAFSPNERDRMLALLDQACDLFQNQPAMLAHGDFDGTHIFAQAGEYTGIIDFGEIRGTHWLYDLAHFAIENSRLFPLLLDGYCRVRPLTIADRRDLQITSLLIAARRIGRCMVQRRPAHEPDIEYVQRQLPNLSRLLLQP